MKTQIGKKGRIRLPEALMAEMGLQKGDLFDAVRLNETVVLMPLCTCPKGWVKDLKEEVARIKGGQKDGNAPDVSALEQLLEVCDGE